MPYIPMINPQTGEIDPLLVAERAQQRAASEYGSPDTPPSPLREAYLRSATQWCMDRAQSERYDWRRSRNLPDDRPMCSMPIPAWGASGDSFGAR